MNSDTILQVLKKGFRVTLGATASLVETLQDPQKREENFYTFRENLSERVQEWAEKGEITEQEARNLVDSILRQRQSQGHPPATETPRESTSTTNSPTAPPNVQQEMQELTAQLAAMRAELERLRDSESSP